MFNSVGKFSVSKVVRGKAVGLVLSLSVVFLSPDPVLSAQTAKKNEKCDQILDQAVNNNESNIYLEILKCELEEANAAFAAAGGATLGTAANLNQPSITGGDITLNPPSTGGIPAAPVVIGPIVVTGIPTGPVET